MDDLVLLFGEEATAEELEAIADQVSAFIRDNFGDQLTDPKGVLALMRSDIPTDELLQQLVGSAGHTLH